METHNRDAKKLTGEMPESLNITPANLINIEKAQLPQILANRLIRLVAFQNPEFYKAQARRMSVWDNPRIIGCAENYPRHIALPRGCFDAVQDLLQENGIYCELQDERYKGKSIDVGFAGKSRGLIDCKMCGEYAGVGDAGVMEGHHQAQLLMACRC